ncbi:hypothetical protein AAHE18_06G136300 [Arachis hypogaea]
MDPYFHHYRRPNTYIPLPPTYNHHHLRQVPNHVLVNPTAFNFNPPVFLPANPLFVPLVPVLFEHDSRHRSQCYRSLLQILTLAAVLPGSGRSALAEQTAVAMCLFLRIPVSNRNFARKRCETLLSRQRLWNWIGMITIEQIGFMNIMAFQKNRLRVRVLFLESRRQNRAMNVVLHDLDSANAQPQGGQESIDECK